jgi:hypothetical protein
MEAGMAQTIEVELPHDGIETPLVEALAVRGLVAETVQVDGHSALVVRFAVDERERLLVETVHAIEACLASESLDFVVQAAGDGAVVRPPAG